MRAWIVALSFIAGLAPFLAHGGEASVPSAADQQAIRGIIEAQLDAFQRDDSSAAGQQAFIESLPPAAMPKLQQVTEGVITAVSAGLVGQAVSLPDNVQASFGDVVQDSFNQRTPTDVNALVQYVLRESYMETTKDLYHYAEKVKFFNNVKKNIRDELAKAG